MNFAKGIRKDFQPPLKSMQARSQGFPEGGSSTRNASRAPRGRGSGGRSRPPEALGYLEQNPQSSNFQAFHSYFRKVLFFKDFHQI